MSSSKGIVLSRTKQRFFHVVLVFLPLLFFVLFESTLRLADYGGNLDLVLMKEVKGKKFYTLNEEVGRRYFSEKRYYLPRVYDDRFEVEKSKNTVRIFCLGASTTAGFPYEYQATPPRLLRDRLELSLPGKNLEVINVGLTATNSFSVREFAQELVQYQPDLFVVYMGQNEFYGAYGVGSTVSLGKFRWLINGYLWLQHFKVIQLIRDGISALRSLVVSEKEGVKRGTLMEQMVRNSLIPFGGTEYQYAKDSFEANYRDVIEVAKDHAVLVVISTLVTNEKDLEPFVSLFREGLPGSSKSQWERLYLEGYGKEQAGHYSEAVDYYLRAVEIDSIPAKVHFRLGKCYQALREYENATNEFGKARDFDGLRFRAPSEFNRIIRGLADRYDIALADVETAFRDRSGDGIIGGELLWEHVHPNLDGYFVMAKTWAHAIRTHHLLVSQAEWAATAEVSDSSCWNYAAITGVDRAIGAVRIAELMRKWPFQPTDTDLQFDAKTIAEQVALQYIQENTAWSRAHERAAEEYRGRKQWKDALMEYAAILKVAPESQYSMMMMGDMLIQMEKYDEAEQKYVRALESKEDQFVHVRLGMFYLERGKPEASIVHLRKCLELDGRLPSKLPLAGRRQAQFYLGLAYAKSGKFAEAKRELTSLLQEDPASDHARMLLDEIESKAQ